MNSEEHLGLYNNIIEEIMDRKVQIHNAIIELCGNPSVTDLHIENKTLFIHQVKIDSLCIRSIIMKDNYVLYYSGNHCQLNLLSLDDILLLYKRIIEIKK